MLGIVRQARDAQAITMRTMFGVLCVYLLIGMAFAFAYGMIAAIEDGGVLRPDRRGGDQADFLYFSFATMTTTGFGDLTAADDLGRSLAITEALIGQIYLVTVVALIVGNLGLTPPLGVAERERAPGAVARRRRVAAVRRRGARARREPPASPRSRGRSPAASTTDEPASPSALRSAPVGCPASVAADPRRLDRPDADRAHGGRPRPTACAGEPGAARSAAWSSSRPRAPSHGGARRADRGAAQARRRGAARRRRW